MIMDLCVTLFSAKTVEPIRKRKASLDRWIQLHTESAEMYFDLRLPFWYKLARSWNKMAAIENLKILLVHFLVIQDIPQKWILFLNQSICIWQNIAKKNLKTVKKIKRKLKWTKLLNWPKLSKRLKGQHIIVKINKTAKLKKPDKIANNCKTTRAAKVSETGKAQSIWNDRSGLKLSRQQNMDKVPKCARQPKAPKRMKLSMPMKAVKNTKTVIYCSVH